MNTKEEAADLTQDEVVGIRDLKNSYGWGVLVRELKKRAENLELSCDVLRSRNVSGDISPSFFGRAMSGHDAAKSEILQLIALPEIIVENYLEVEKENGQ